MYDVSWAAYLQELIATELCSSHFVEVDASSGDVTVQPAVGVES